MNDTDSADEPPSLGPCCLCETYVGVTNIVMLPRRAPIPGRGWGCIVCGLPQDGAVAVLCDGCMDLLGGGAKAWPPLVCRGWPAHDGRIAWTDLSEEPFDHDAMKHEEEEAP